MGRGSLPNFNEVVSIKLNWRESSFFIALFWHLTSANLSATLESVFYSSGASFIDFQTIDTDNVIGRRSPPSLPLGVSLLYKTLPFVGRAHNLLLTNRLRQRRWNAIPMVILYYLRFCFSRTKWQTISSGLEEATSHAVNCLQRGPHTRKLQAASTLQPVKSQIPQSFRCQQEINFANNLNELWSRFSSIKPPNENTAQLVPWLQHSQ